MGLLTFHYGTMNCGKSTLALQMHHNATAAGQTVMLVTKHDREGDVISSRIGLAQPATVVDDETDLFVLVRDTITSGVPVDEVICDEAQFLSGTQVDQLARAADDLDVEVRCFGLLTDFTTRLFPGSRRLLELADRREELQVEARCWCGRRGTHNARTVGGRIVRYGEQVVVGDMTGETAYEVLCRRHHRLGVTREVADGQPDGDGAQDQDDPRTAGARPTSAG